MVLKERATSNEIKHELAQIAATDLLPNESNATANISMLACLQTLSTASLVRLCKRGSILLTGQKVALVKLVQGRIKI